MVPALNARMTELQALLVRNQLQRLDTIIAERRAIADHYLGALSGFPDISIQRGVGEMLWQAFAMTCEGVGFAQIKAGMAQNGVAIARAGVATHLEPWYAQKYGYTLPGSASLGREAFTLPSFEGMRAQELNHVIHALLSTINQITHS
mgnify:CR=1 FL=1